MLLMINSTKTNRAARDISSEWHQLYPSTVIGATTDQIEDVSERFFLSWVYILLLSVHNILYTLRLK